MPVFCVVGKKYNGLIGYHNKNGANLSTICFVGEFALFLWWGLENVVWMFVVIIMSLFQGF